jgi:sarcosine oxidase delta subunit
MPPSQPARPRKKADLERRPRRVFSYVVASDSGFAPNPFHGWCTLACCKPKIRTQAQPGDLVVGLSSRCERIVYVMEVAETTSFAEYWEDARFLCKRPALHAAQRQDRCGDNIYRPNQNGTYTQIPSGHWDHANGCESLRKKQKDTSVDVVLVGSEFVYFGEDRPVLPEPLRFLSVTRGHRSHFTHEQIEEVQRFFRSAPRGLRGQPEKWRGVDESWIPGCD